MKGVLTLLFFVAGSCNCVLAVQNHADISTASYRTYSFKDGTSLSYSKPGFLKTLGAGPADFGSFVSDSFKKDKLPWLAAIAASTLILIEYDQEIYNGTKRLGKKFSISTEDKTTTFLKVGGVPVFRGPTDLGSAMYFIGDGWVSIGLFGTLEAYGLLKDDWRSQTTAHQLVKGLLLTGFATASIKNITGRETPSAASAPRGVWRFFPGFKEYIKHRTRYDAFPSGHLATAMMTLTVMTENYPEKKYIKPLGYTLMAALSFQMVNNSVHWASDYPLGLAIGYGIGKAVAVNGRASARRSGPQKTSGLNFYPYVTPDGSVGGGLAYRF
ncbi:MAG TPA: hypothetical protein DCL44_06165 [Elusimicrobia bacterium]|nr:hypothetical protein [Elusimicrobiota bacterium]